MHDKMKSLIAEISINESIYDFDESTTKRVIILRVLDAIGWNIFNDKEVVGEYSMAGKRVDYSLKIQGTNKVFIEAKRVSEDLEKHQEQLLNYAFKKGIKLAVLTNGVAWWFYLPLKEGNWDKRKFFAIDILEQDPNDIACNFVDFLSIASVTSGEAIQKAEKIYKGHVKKIEINKNMPSAWNKLISEPDELLVELLGETLEKLCGFRADNSHVENFLEEHQAQFTILQTMISNKPSALTTNKLTDNSSCKPAAGKKSPSFPTDPWLEQVPELKKVSGLKYWADICRHLKIDVGGDSARRALSSWVKKNKQSWPNVP